MTARLTALTDRACACVQSRVADIQDREAGMTTAEYAVGTVAAIALAGTLFKIITSDNVTSLFGKLIIKKLTGLF